jgi:hypothetical protein
LAIKKIIFEIPGVEVRRAKLSPQKQLNGAILKKNWKEMVYAMNPGTPKEQVGARE